MRRLLTLGLLLIISATAGAEIKTEEVTYKDGKQKLQGFFAYDDAISGKRPGIVVVHEWWGHGDYVRMRAKQLAELGYIAFALDMYGKGVYAKDHKEAAELSGIYRNDRKLARRRFKAGLDVLLKHKLTDNNKIGALGYCFGGGTVIEMARAGMDLAGVVALHGLSIQKLKEEKKDIKAAMFVGIGGSDHHISHESVQSFMDEMTDANADWQLIYYGGAVHSFTVEAAGNDPSTGAAYDAKADARSWEDMKDFFQEVLK